MTSRSTVIGARFETAELRCIEDAARRMGATASAILRSGALELADRLLREERNEYRGRGDGDVSGTSARAHLENAIKAIEAAMERLPAFEGGAARLLRLEVETSLRKAENVAAIARASAP